MSATPSLLVFDVNETLIDIDSIGPLFERIFGDPRTLRQWFDQLVLYSMTTTIAEHYVDFFSLGQGLLQMLADIHHVELAEADVREIRQHMLTMPAHPDVADGLAILCDNGFRLITLTNSPPNPAGPSPLDQAGLGRFFERQLSVDALRMYKPAQPVYRYVCDELRVAAPDCMMVAAHVWDTMGAQSAGFSAALITRPGNAPLPIDGLRQPDVVATDLRDLADQLAR
jgi:2-haloacid dehalogenase